MSRSSELSRTSPTTPTTSASVHPSQDSDTRWPSAILVGPELAGQPAAHDHDGRTPGHVPLVEVPPGQQRNPQRPEESRGDDADVGRRLFAARGQGTVEDTEPRRRSDAAERRRAQGRRGFDARQSRHPRDGLADEGALPLRRRIGPAREADAHGEDALRPESRIDVGQPPEAAQQEAGARSQDQGERDLGHDQRGLEPPPGVGRAPRLAPFLERRHQRGARLLEGGREAEEHGAGQRQPRP